MRIGVTGALGHIGSRLIRDLPGTFDDCEFLLVDDLSTQRYSSLFNLPESAGYRFIEADILKADLERLFDGLDAVVHLAAVTNAESSFDKADHVHTVNFEGTKAVADACCRKCVPMVFVSTTSVYGSQERVVDETCEDLKPQSPYAESKLKAERYVQSLAASGLRSVIFRFGTIYGISPGMRFHTAVNKFCWQAAMGLPITVWRTALDQYRPYLDIRDAVNAVAFAVENKLFDSTVYNVVTNNETVRTITDEIKKVIPEVELSFVDSKIMNQLSYNVSSDKFRNSGFAFNGDIADGISETLKLLQNANAVQSVQ